MFIHRFFVIDDNNSSSGNNFTGLIKIIHLLFGVFIIQCQKYYILLCHYV